MKRRTQLLIALAGPSSVVLASLAWAQLSSSTTTAPATTQLSATVDPATLRRTQRLASAAAAPVSDAIAPAARMDEAFSVLAARSLFYKGLMRRASNDSGPDDIALAARAAAAEHSLAFVGTMRNGDTIMAFVEDASAGRVIVVQPGEPLAQGNIGTITLDQMDYVANGITTHVGVGENLRGERVASPAPPPPPSASSGSNSSGGGDSGGPDFGGNGGPPAATFGTSSPPASQQPPAHANDILERMRRRRQQMGGK